MNARPTTVHVCVSCRAEGEALEPREARAGARLHAALVAAAARNALTGMGRNVVAMPQYITSSRSFSDGVASRKTATSWMPMAPGALYQG